MKCILMIIAIILSSIYAEEGNEKIVKKVLFGGHHEMKKSYSSFIDLINDVSSYYLDIGVTTRPNDKQPNKLYFFMFSDKGDESKPRRIIVYKEIENIYEKLDEWDYDGSKGGIYQAYLIDGKIHYHSGMANKLVLIRDPTVK